MLAGHAGRQTETMQIKLMLLAVKIFVVAVVVVDDDYDDEAAVASATWNCHMISRIKSTVITREVVALARS
jgi:hypothetical protein